MISDILPTGAENAITARELANLLGWSVRQVTATVEAERRIGKPICSSNSKPHGYYMAADRQELADFCKRQYGRGREVIRTYWALLDVIPKLPETAEP